MNQIKLNIETKTQKYPIYIGKKISANIPVPKKFAIKISLKNPNTRLTDVKKEQINDDLITFI